MRPEGLPPEYQWCCEMLGTGPDGWLIYAKTPPNRFHRLMQRFLLGSKWTRL